MQIANPRLHMPSYSPNDGSNIPWFADDGGNINNNDLYSYFQASPPPPPPPPPPPLLQQQQQQQQFDVIGMPVPPPPPPPPNEQKFYCELCKVACPNEISLMQHINGARHRSQEILQRGEAAAAAHRPQFHCDICGITCNRDVDYQIHLKGNKHKRKVAAGHRSGNDERQYNRHTDGGQHRAVVETKAELLFAGHYGPDVAASMPHNEPKVANAPSLAVTVAVDISNEQGKMMDIITKGKLTGAFHCAICNLDLRNELVFGQHINGKRHAKNVKLQSKGNSKEALAQVHDAVLVAKTNILDDTSTHQEQSSQPTPALTIESSTALREKLPMATSSNAHIAMKNSDSDEEEGEVDEVKEDIDKLYDDFEKPKSTGSDNTFENSHISTNLDVGDDSDVDEMFGNNDDDVASSTWKNIDEAVSVGSLNNSQKCDGKSDESKLVTNHLGDDCKSATNNEPIILDSGVGIVLDFSPDKAINGNIPDSTEREAVHQGIGKGNGIISSVAPVVIEEQQGEKAKKSRWTASTTMPVTSTAMPTKIVSKPNYDAPKERSYYTPVHPDQYWCCMRDWDFLRDLNHAIKNSGPLPRKSRKRSLDSNARAHDNKSSVDSIPNTFESVEQYKAVWAPLLINEAKAQLLSDVVASQASPNTSWIQGSNTVVGSSVRLEVSRTARDHSTSSTENLNSSEPSIVLHINPSNTTGSIRPVSTNDLLLFVHQTSAIERAVRGTFDEESGNQELQKGRFGFVGHALNNRSRSLDGLLVRVSKKYWIQFESLKDMIVVHIGSHVTALREFNALCRVDSIPLIKYIIDGKKTTQKSIGSCSSTIHTGSNEKSCDHLPASEKIASDNLLPAGFQNFITSKMNTSQQDAITASASEYGDGGFTLIKGPPGTGKTTTLVSILNALHLRQYQEYYNSIERIVTGSDDSTYYEELAALNKAAEMKPRILVCAPSNAGIDNVILKIMSDKFVDGQGGNYAPSITRVGAGITSSKIESVTLKQSVDNIIAQGCDTINLENTIANLRNSLKRIQKEMQKLRARLKAMVECCPYEISSEWEIRIDEQSFENTGQVLFVNHSTKTTTFELPLKVRPTETPCVIHQMPHYRSLVKFLTKFVERYSNEWSNLEKYIMLQNAANSKMDGDRGGSSTDGSMPMSLLEEKIAIAVLNSSHIVLTTLGSAGGRAMTSANRFKVVVIDEAAQSAEPSSLVALQLGSKHAILVGDPQQLPATIFSVSGRSTKYDRSLFQRLEEADHDVHMLNMQYRMHPMISKFPRHIFYQDNLLDGPNVLRSDFGGSFKTMLGIKFPSVRPFNMYDLDSKEERNGTSLSNKYEAKLAVQLYSTLDRVSDGLLVKTRVAIITPYSQQSSLLHRLFEEKYGPTYIHRVEIR